MIIYRAYLKRFKNSTKPDVQLFYDEDRDKVISEMKKYVKKNGFSIKEKSGTFTISDVVLREEESTGEFISETPYHKLFDTVTGRRLEEAIG